MHDDSTTIAAILAALAAGDDPFTGLPLPPEQRLTDPRIRAALGAAAERLDPDMRLDAVRWAEPAPGSARPDEDDDPERQGKAWSAEEVERLVDAFDRGASIRELAADHRRTHGAITARLVYLGLRQVETRKGDAKFVHHVEHGHLLSRALDGETLARAARLLLAEDPAGAEDRLLAAVDLYLARPDPPVGLSRAGAAAVLASLRR